MDNTKLERILEIAQKMSAAQQELKALHRELADLFSTSVVSSNNAHPPTNAWPELPEYDKIVAANKRASELVARPRQSLTKLRKNLLKQLNPRASVQREILKALPADFGLASSRNIAVYLSRDMKSVQNALCLLVKSGLVERVTKGMYRLPKHKAYVK